MIVHTCSCGKTYEQHEWDELSLVGHSAAEDPDNILEQRNCSCGSTRALEMPGPGFWLWLCGQRVAEARLEAQNELPSLSRAYLERAQTCLEQAREILKMLAEERTAKVQANDELLKMLAGQRVAAE